MIVWNLKGIPTRSMENMKWYSPSQVSTAKHESYPQLTATGILAKLWLYIYCNSLFRATKDPVKFSGN